MPDVELTLDIGEDGVAVGAGDTARTRFAAAVVLVNAVPAESVSPKPEPRRS